MLDMKLYTCLAPRMPSEKAINSWWNNANGIQGARHVVLSITKTRKLTLLEFQTRLRSK